MPAPLPELRVPRIGPTDRLVALPPLRLTDARTGALPRLATSVRLAVRGAALCIRFDARDEGLVATLRDRDAPLWTEDVCEVFLAPEDSHAPRRYYELEVNPLGTLFDARVDSPDGKRATMMVDPSWDCAGLAARAQSRPGHWSASLTIPLAALCEEPIPVRWRANFFRIDRGETAGDEFTAWSPTFADPPDFHIPERFGLLHLPV